LGRQIVQAGGAGAPAEGGGTPLSPQFTLEFNLFFAGDAQLAVLGRFRF